jgi:putative flippase GtrA
MPHRKKDMSILRRFIADAQGQVTARESQVAELWRYYGVALVNTIFGYGVYSIFVFLHLNIYIAQILSRIFGMTFNYFTYKNHVFAGSGPNRVKYILAYLLGYVLGVGFLTIFHSFVRSPYIAGFLSLICVSLINYFVLRKFVFASR